MKERSNYHKENIEKIHKLCHERRKEIKEKLCKLKKELKYGIKDPESLFCNPEYKKLVPKCRKIKK